MIFWIGLFILEIVLLYLYKTTSSNKRKGVILWCLILSLVYFSGFRDGLGMDYSSYQELCEREVFSIDSFFLLSEPVFRGLQSFCYNTEFSAVILFLVSAFLTCSCSLLTYSKFENFTLAAIVFIFFTDIFLSSMNIVSQFAAAGVILLGYYPLIKERNRRNILYAIFAIFCATLLHLSSIFMIVPLFFNSDRININLWILLIVASYIIPVDIIFRIPIIGDILELLNYSNYTDYATVGLSKLSLTNLYMHLLLIPFIINIKSIKTKKNATEYFTLLKMYAMYLILNNLSTGSITITYRLAVFFVLFLPLLLAKLPNLINKQLAYTIIIIPLLILMSLRLSSGDKLTVPDRILPLESILDKHYNPYSNPYE